MMIISSYATKFMIRNHKI